MKHFVYYHGTITPLGVKNLEILILDKLRIENSELVIGICSGGGDVVSGLGFYNFAKALNVPLHTHNMGNCGSIAATMFLAGTVRTAAPMSSFSLHAATYISGPRTGEVSENTNLISLPFKEDLKWDDEKIIRYFSTPNEIYIPPNEAIDLGILHKIESIAVDPTLFSIVNI